MQGSYFGGNNLKLMPDGNYGTVRLGDVRLYMGYLDHWWGPGNISALSLSNNARPMPQVGIERADTQSLKAVQGLCCFELAGSLAV